MIPLRLVKARVVQLVVASLLVQSVGCSSKLCIAPTASTAYTTAASGQPYSSASTNNVLSLYTPTAGSGWPLVVWIHGGGWNNSSLMYNSAFTLSQVVNYLTPLGFAVASIEYRFTTALDNPAPMPAQVQDVRCAMMWLKSRSSTYGYSAKNVVTPEAQAELAALVSPAAYVAALSVPLWIVHGSSDANLPVAPIRSFVAKARSRGAQVTYLEVQGADHTALAGIVPGQKCRLSLANNCHDSQCPTVESGLVPPVT